jgi:eukaryotic-like serine/threonine-protein kinase
VRADEEDRESGDPSPSDAVDGASGSGRESLPEPLTPGTRVGRYELIQVIDGTVWRARDPHLSREVALVLLQPHLDESHGADESRLLSETRALANVSHPNVVAAYDVGIHGGSVFIAMELVVGVSLHTWLLQRPPPNEVLRASIAAGRGLAAVHAAGVLHGDFQPSNVMVSPGGHIRVVNFDPARTARAVHGASAEPVRALSGALGYMAPELLSGDAPNAAADQFSYAATVFAALAGRPPYPADTLDAYSSAQLRGERAAWPRRVPTRLRRVVERGLALRPEKRHPSVAAMVEALERAAAPRRAPVLIGALAAVALAVTGAIAVSRQVIPRVACNLDATPFQHVWDDARRTALERAFLATGRSNAAEALGRLSRRLDDFRSSWLTMKQASCEATHVRGEQSERVASLRSACLNRKLAGFRALVDAFSEVDARMIDRAGGVTPESLGDCADVAALMGNAAQLPDDPQRRAWIEEVEGGYDITNALLTAGRWQAAVERAQGTLERARQTDYAPALALATSNLGRAKSGAARTNEEHREAELLLSEAVRLAARAGDDAQLARASSFLFTVIAQQNRIQEAEAMLPSAEALVIRGGNRPDQRIEILYGRSNIFIAHRQFAEAVEVLKEVERLAPSASGERRHYGHTAAAKTGSIYAELGRYDEAVAALERGAEADRQAYGDTHPRVLLALINLAIVQGQAQRREAALATIARAKELAAKLAPDEPSARHIPSVEGQIWDNGGDCARAIPFYRSALAIYTQTDGANHPMTADAHAQLGRCLAKAGQASEAISELERALAIRRKNGSAPTAAAQAAFELATALWAAPDRRRQSRSLAEEALALWRGESNPEEAAKIERWLSERR